MNILATLADAPAWQKIIFLLGMLAGGFYTVAWAFTTDIRPKCIKWAIGFGVYISIHAISEAWDERRFVAVFAESFVALVLYWGSGIGGLVGGWYIGALITEKTRRGWLGYIVGITAGVAIMISVFMVAQRVPGVGWRFDKIVEQHQDDD